MVLALAAVAALWWYAGGGFAGFGDLPALPDSAVAVNSRPEAPRFLPLSDADRVLLSRQRALVDELARRHVGAGLTGRSLDDLRVLQETLDRAAPSPDETYRLQAFGVALGDVLAARLALSWAVYEDPLGRSRALQIDESQALFPVTMISKRVELGVPFRVEELYRDAARTVERARAGRGASQGADTSVPR